MEIKDNMLNKLIQKTRKDKIIQEILSNLANNNKLVIDKDRLIYMYRLIYIPYYIRQEIIKIYYNKSLQGHFGTERIYKQII